MWASLLLFFEQHMRCGPAHNAQHGDKDRLWLACSVKMEACGTKLLNVLLSIVPVTHWPLVPTCMYTYTHIHEPHAVQSSSRGHVIHHLCWSYKYRPVLGLFPSLGQDTNEIILCKYVVSLRPEDGGSWVGVWVALLVWNDHGRGGVFFLFFITNRLFWIQLRKTVIWICSNSCFRWLRDTVQMSSALRLCVLPVSWDCQFSFYPIDLFRC